MRVMIAGGGTGGHLFPGLAVADEFRSRDASTEVVFVGTEYGIEARVVPRELCQLAPQAGNLPRVVDKKT